MGGASVVICERPPLQKTLPSKKSSGFEFLNLTLRNKKIEFIPIKPYASLREARENFPQNDLSLLLAHLYASARTFFVEKKIND